MVDEPSRPPRRRCKRRWLLLGGLLSPVIAVLLGNLFLATPWGARWLGGRLSVRTGFTAELKRACWTPWGGFVIEDLRLSLPASSGVAPGVPPLVRIGRVEADLYWQEVLHGRRSLSRLVLRNAEVMVPLEMLAHLASPGGATEVVVPTAPALTLTPGPVAGAPTATPPMPTSPPGPTAAPAPPPPVVPAPVDSRLPLRVRIEGGRLSVVSGVHFKPLWELIGLNADVPVQGGQAHGSLSFSEMKGPDFPLSGPVEVPIEWRSPEIQFGPAFAEVAGVKVQLGARLARLPGAPALLEAAVAAQPLAGWPADLPEAQRTVAAKDFKAILRASGLLQTPASWEGLLIAEAEGIRVRRPASEHDFDRGRVQLLLQRGVLSCPDARLIGESASLLGNGLMIADGRGMAVLRLVLPPETAAGLSARFSRRLEGMEPKFSEMETPDRRMIDLRWVPYQGGTGIELGEGGPVAPAPLVFEWLAAE